MSSLGEPRDAKRRSSGRIFLSYPHTHYIFLYYNLFSLVYFQVTPFTVYRLFMPKYALAVEINHEGQLVGSLQDPGALKIGAVSEIFEYNNTIYIGHFESPYLGVINMSLVRSCLSETEE